MEIPEAIKLLPRATRPGAFSSTFIYSLPKEPGLYRRVSREGRNGLQPGEGNTVAIIEDRLCELVRWTEGEQLLRPLLPGVESPNSDEEGKPF